MMARAAAIHPVICTPIHISRVVHSLDGIFLVNSVTTTFRRSRRDSITIGSVAHWLTGKSLMSFRGVESVGIIVEWTHCCFTVFVGTHTVMQCSCGVTGCAVEPVPTSSKHVSTHCPRWTRHIVVSPNDRRISTKTLTAHRRCYDNDDCSVQHDDVTVSQALLLVV